MRLFWIRTLMILSFVLLFAGVSVSLASSAQKTGTTAAEVKSDAAQTYDLLKRYTVEQRDEAVAAAEKMMTSLDARISELQHQLDSQWQDMSQAAREKTRATLDTLQKEREKVAEWYGGMRHSSASAWEDVKKGFANSYDQLKKNFSKALADFENSK